MAERFALAIPLALVAGMVFAADGRAENPSARPTS
jgi:hypothetical protein